MSKVLSVLWDNCSSVMYVYVQSVEKGLIGMCQSTSKKCHRMTPYTLTQN